ncbi:MAG: hypothetical protein IH594_01550 [Bacteroidales bacterium]|nr:hypothetical protein [Bacteroidales bacterium]
MSPLPEYPFYYCHSSPIPTTPGLSNNNPEELHYKYIPRPIYPLDEIDKW